MNLFKIGDRAVVVEQYRSSKKWVYVKPNVTPDQRQRSPSEESSCSSRQKDKSSDRSVSQESHRSKQVKSELKNLNIPLKSYPGTRLFVKGLGPYRTKDNLRQLFGHFGDITGVEVSDDRKVDSAHVWFNDHKEALNASKTLNGMSLGTDWELRVKLANPEESGFGIWRVFVDNMHKDIDDKIMHTKFKTYGRVLVSKVWLDDRQRSEGYGFVAFFDKESADKAVKDNGSRWWRRHIKIEHFDLDHREVRTRAGMSS